MGISRGINHIGLTVPNIEDATKFFKEGLDGKIAYDSQKKDESPRDGEHVEHILGLEEGAKIIKKRMMVFGNGPNIEMFEFQDAKQAKPDSLQDVGFTHISFYVDDFEKAFEQIQKAGGEPISQPHDNTKYEDTAGNKTVYVKAPWGSLIELQTVPEGFYYPSDSEAEVFIPKK
ncbi:VOC family protein [Mammaliicoccus lentus]|uniref:VOC family protein n=1 Tax=Mammaliicoccus lentus TaxID=42858 RepID=UPI002B25F112|nr:VOC family protein [Mammaliicoccus lentus]WQK50400.1 VOC family protein [Mammaliicoccus lentus]